MKLVMLALWDEKIGEFMTPFFAQTAAAAMRSCGDLVNGRGQEPPAQHPEDFRLYVLGEWSGDGYFDLKKSPELVCELVNLRHDVPTGGG